MCSDLLDKTRVESSFENNVLNIGNKLRWTKLRSQIKKEQKKLRLRAGRVQQ